MDNAENTVNSTETASHGDVADAVENEELGAGVESADGADTPMEPEEGEETVFDDASECEYDEEAELSELRRISGVEYGGLSEFSGYRRYLELKRSGVLTAEEAFYAVNRGRKARNAEYDGVSTTNGAFESVGSKRHMTATRRKPSSGEVFTRADREELAKWGISATGSELERLWREAGR